MDDIDREKDSDWGEPTDVHEIEFAGSSTLKEFTEEDESDLIKVEGTANASWRGVSGCCDQGRVDSEVATAVGHFTTAQKAAHPTLTYVRTEHGTGKGECRKWSNWPNGRRCNGTISVPVWAYFRNP